MSTQIQITPASGITVGTTAVTSGTIGRVFFQGTGDVVQQSASLFWDNTNARLGVGATPATTVRLDVRAQGALSTDIAFRVRNSANTADIINVKGNGDAFIGLDAGRVNTGANNSFFGIFAGYSNTSGAQNSFFGQSCGLNNTTGGNNSFFGLQSGNNNTTGAQNSFFGQNAGYSNTTAANNSFFGQYAGFNNTTGANNSFFWCRCSTLYI